MKTPYTHNDYTTSVKSIIRLLNELKTNPETKIANLAPLWHLKSQGNLCKLDIPDRNIIPSSLNTFKRYCAQSAPGGFEAIDALRSTVFNLVKQTAEEPVQKKRKNQKQLTEQLKSEINQLNIDLLTTTKILLIAIRQATFYAEASRDPKIIELYHKERNELLDMLTCVRSDLRGYRLEKII